MEKISFSFSSHCITWRSLHSREMWGRGACAPSPIPAPSPKNRGKYFTGNYHVKFAHFSGKNAKFGNFVDFPANVM